jgi:quaternary ammonium compound-resistance protein SugE
MAWVILVVAGLFEVGWAVGLKHTEGFTRLWPTAWTVLAMIISLWLLGIAMKFNSPNRCRKRRLGYLPDR